jgi:hypothetical protein
MDAMTADKGISIVAMADIRLDRIQEKRTQLKLKFPAQVAVDDDHCFTGFDAYKHVIASSMSSSSPTPPSSIRSI